ncbi:MAG: hypothetical protein U9M97_00555, partial [Candidatus Hadarchaeota archaeon]|nr:hypothetical protein [Candidatus Hadarchaeota archaeon]
MRLDHLYTRLCRAAGRYQKLRRRAPGDLAQNLELSGLDLEAEEVAALAILGAIVDTALVLVAAFASIFLGLPIIIPIALSPLPILLFVI